MCAVSMVTQNYFDQYPNPYSFPLQQWPDYAELRRKAALYDQMTGQPDCPDPKKAAWHAEVEKIMAEKYGLHPKA